jgi:hypothetical protein
MNISSTELFQPSTMTRGEYMKRREEEEKEKVIPRVGPWSNTSTKGRS